MSKKIIAVFAIFFFLSAGFPAFAFESSSASFEIHAGDVESMVGASGPSANFKLQSGGGQTATGIDGPSSPTGFKVFSGILNWMLGWFTPRYNQVHYRWRNDDGSEITATSGVGEDAEYVSFPKTTTKRLRFEISNEGWTRGTVQFKLQSAPLVSTCSAGAYTDVTTSSTDWIMVTSANFVDGDNTSNFAGSLTDVYGSTRWVIGKMVESTSNTTAAITLGANQFTEIEYSIQATSASSGSYCFQVIQSGGSALSTYASYAKATVVSGGTIPADGTYESPVFDSVQGSDGTSGIKSGFNTITWIETVPSNTNVRFQVASSDCSNAGTDPPTCTAGAWNYLGPNGSAGTYYESSATNYCSGSGTILCRISADHNNKRYFRYKIQLCGENSAVCTVSTNGSTTPKVEKVILNWSP